MANESSSRSLELTAWMLPHRSRLVTTLWWIMLLSSVAIGAYSTRYFLGLPSDEHFSRYILPLRLHIAGGIGALLTGPWQFSEKLRARALHLHRWLGRFYLLEVALGSVAGFRYGNGFRAGLGYSPGLRNAGRSVVFYGPAKRTGWCEPETSWRTATG